MSKEAAAFLTCTGQGKAAAHGLSPLHLEIKTAFIRCETEMDVTVPGSAAG